MEVGCVCRCTALLVKHACREGASVGEGHVAGGRPFIALHLLLGGDNGFVDIGACLSVRRA